MAKKTSLKNFQNQAHKKKSGSRLNGAVKIFIRGHFDKKWVPLPKVILSQNPQKDSERYQKPPDTKEGSI
uniref:Uncharacterized protein n=1 Tax=Solanum demissum TaxID=50514 RepID=Q0KIP0_SOLDE|nr:hypothetical protein SDM1_27t00010 [Solanum demissum]